MEKDYSSIQKTTKVRWKKITDVGISSELSEYNKLIKTARMSLEEAKAEAQKNGSCFFIVEKGKASYKTKSTPSNPSISFYSGDPIYTKSFSSDAYEKQNHNEPNKIKISSFQGEAIGGKDYLNITPDVEAFANLISSRELKPPLSVGLFGDWGSGKSFFMNKIHEEVTANMNWAKKKVKDHTEEFILAMEVLSKEKKQEEINQKIKELFPTPEDKYAQIETWISTKSVEAFDLLASNFTDSENLVKTLIEDPLKAKLQILVELEEKHNKAAQELSQGFMDKDPASLSNIRKLVEVYEERKLGYCRNISQIRFNAWHYVDSNLWASMISNIFEDLGSYIGLLSPEEAKVIKLWEDLQSTQALIQENEEVRTSLKESKAQLDLELKSLRVEKTSQETRLSALSLRSVWNEIISGEATQDIQALTSQKIEKAKKSLGITETIDWKTDTARLDELYNNFNSTRGKAVKIYQELNPSKWSTNTRILVGLFMLSLLAIWMLSGLDKISDTWLPAVAKAVAFLTSMYGLFGKVMTKGGAALEKINTGLNLLNSAKNSVNRLQEEATQEYQNRLGDTKSELAIINRKIEEKSQEIESLNKEEVKIAGELAAIRNGKRLSSFIQRRLDSSDYKKHLGLISIIRDDFEKLADYLHNKNSLDDFLSQKPETALAQDVLPHNPFLLSPVNKIDRIVLYIDDLDRCPPDKVVEVLEAIHLILAFPLFVVVVGVDVRWISKSLMEKYGAMLNTEKDQSGGDHELSLLHKGSATPYDYLEKIFQIPFRIKSMDTHDKKIYLEKLLESDLNEPLVESETHAYQYPQSEESTTNAPSNTNIENGQSEPMPKKLTKVQLGKEDLGFIQSLAPIISNSPRAIKRFANICRLIKSHQKWTRPSSNESDAMKLTEYKSMVFLFAFISGLPVLADHLIIQLQHWLDSLSNSKTSASKTLSLANFATHVKGQKKKSLRWENYFSDAEDPRLQQEWEILYQFLNGRQKHHGETTEHRMYQHFEQLSVYDILDQAKTAFRFSFRFDEY